MVITRQTGLFFIALSIAIWAYWSGLSEAVLRWEIQEEYSHGFLIPLVTLYILWEKRNLILSSASAPLWHGVWLIVIASIVFLVAEVLIFFHNRFKAWLVNWNNALD